MKKTTKMTVTVLAGLSLLAGCVLVPTTSAESLSTSSGSSETVLVAGATPSSGNKSAFAFTAPSTGTAVPAEIDTSVSARDASGEYDVKEAVYLSSEDDLTITQAGVYILSGSYINKMIIVDASEEDKVQLVLDNAVLMNDSGPAIYIRSADKVFLTASDGTENTISDGSGYTFSDGETTPDAAVFSKEDLTINGSGKLTVIGNTKHAVVSKDDLVITAKNLTVTAVNSCLCGKDSVKISDAAVSAAAGTDGIHSEEFVVITGNTAVNIRASEGIEAAYILITGGEIDIQASDDGINAARKSAAYTPTVEITGGIITVTMGSGDTDGIDSNGNLIISGGTVYVNANSPFDYDGNASFTGGTVYVNGNQVTSLPNQMMGGFGGRGGFREGTGNQDGFRGGSEQGSSGNQEGFGASPGEQRGYRGDFGKHL